MPARAPPWRPQDRPHESAKFVSGLKQGSCPALAAKIFCFPFFRKCDLLPASRLHRRGASRSSRTWEAGCDGRDGAARRAASMRTAKSRGPGASTLAPSPQGDLAGDGGKTARSPRRARISRKPSRRECRLCSAEPVVTAACVPCCRRAMGAASIRHSLRPPRYRGQCVSQSSDESRRENASACPAV
jgi:hypothetical protein